MQSGCMTKVIHPTPSLHRIPDKFGVRMNPAVDTSVDFSNIARIRLNLLSTEYISRY